MNPPGVGARSLAEFDDGHEDSGFGLTARALQVGDAQLYDAAFAMLASKQIAPARVPGSLGMDRPPTLAFLLGVPPPDLCEGKPVPAVGD